MANTFQFKRSSVQGKIPTTSQLALGEIGINTYDGKLFLKKDDGTASIVEVGGSSGGIASVSADTSPQLGGNLDTNTKHIDLGYSSGSSDDRIRFDSTNMQIYYGAIGVSNHGVISTQTLDVCRKVTNPGLGDIVFGFDTLNSSLNIYGNQYSGSTNATLRLYHNNRTNYITITPPYNNQTNYTLTLPTGPGSSGQVLTTNGYGDLSWSTPASTAGFLTTSNGDQTKIGRVTFGSTVYTDRGISILHSGNASGYGSIRGYDGSTSSNNNTIHFFSNSWTNSGTTSGISGSQGCVNLKGSYGVTFGAWNNPEAYVQNNILGVRGDGSATRGSLKLFRDNNNYAVTLAPSNSLASNFTITLPTGTGSNGQVLTTDGNGVTSWTTVSGGSSGISNVVEDTTPQLGGNLDLNSNDITGTGNIDITGTINTTTPLTIEGDGSSTQGKVVLNCENNSHGVTLQAPAHANFSGNYTLTLPTSAGSNGQVLTTNGSGVTSWQTRVGESWTVYQSATGTANNNFELMLGIYTLGNAAQAYRNTGLYFNPYTNLLTTPGASIGGNTYPTVAGSSGQVLTTNGSGTLSWTTVSGGGGSAGGASAITMNDNVNINFGTGADFEMHCDGAGNMYMDMNSSGADSLKIRNGTTTQFTLERTNGNFTATGNITAYSDINLKKDIKPIKNALDKVCKINGVTFQRNDLETKVRFAGVIAQEVQKVLPEVVSTDEQGFKSVAYGNLVGLLIEAIKEQQTQIDGLRKAIEER